MPALPSHEERTQRYLRLMAEIKARLLYVERVTPPHVIEFVEGTIEDDDAFRFETAAVLLRKSLELIAFSALLANAESAASKHANVAQMWRAKRILEAIAQVNPKFFPAPVLYEMRGPGQHHYVDRPGADYLTREQLEHLLDALSLVIHVGNPLGRTDAIELRRPREIIQRIRNLLEMHVMYLGEDLILVVHMNDWSRPGGVEVAHARAK